MAATGRWRCSARRCDLEPGYLPAHGHAAWCHEQRYLRGGFDPADREAALRHADAVLAVNADDPQAMSMGAFVRANLTRDYDGAAEVLDRAWRSTAIRRWPSGSARSSPRTASGTSGRSSMRGKALRLSPLDDPLNYHPYCALALTYLFAGRFAESVKYASLAIRANPGFSACPTSTSSPGRCTSATRGRAGGGRAPARRRAGVLGCRLRTDGPVPGAAHGPDHHGPARGRAAGIARACA